MGNIKHRKDSARNEKFERVELQNVYNRKGGKARRGEWGEKGV
jgi:hypothetical protein